MSWFAIAIIAYFLNAIAMVIDKTLLKKEIPNPVVYVFYIALLGAILILLILPFGLTIPNTTTLIIALISGVVFIAALILMFQALKKDDATRVTSMVGGLTPIFVFIFAWYLLEEKFTSHQLGAIILLIIGSLLIALDFEERGLWPWIEKKMGFAKNISLPYLRKIIWFALPSAALFAISSITAKYVYQNTSFLPGFIWTRAGSLLAVIFLLLFPNNWHAVKESFKKNKENKSATKKTGGRFLFGQACGGASALLQQYAIFLGSVALVNALQGIQYAFVFLIVIILTFIAPKILKENITRLVLIQKITAILLISVGLYLIAL
ncbi:MAG TPA: EamA family transporter [bacterium]|nr:EamA family transporter [bacterium]HPL95362.1 EamA family transporter [bacterium]